MANRSVERPSCRPPRTEIATCAREYEPSSALAYDTARLCLADSLACAFEALQHRECTRLLGPIVPGATMLGGARVPGTSYELDPVKAAFDLGTAIRWLRTNAPAFGTPWGHLADGLGGLLATADWLSRTRVAEGADPLTLRDLLAALLRTHEVRRVLLTDDGPQRSTIDRPPAVEIATAVVVAAMLGGTPEQVLAAGAYAALDGGGPPDAFDAPDAGPCLRWAIGDANSRGVRLALLALADLPGSASAPGVPAPLPSAPRPDEPPPPDAECEAVVRARLGAAVRAHFRAKQAALVEALFADPAALDAKPVHEFVSALVRN